MTKRKSMAGTKGLCDCGEKAEATSSGARICLRCKSMESAQYSSGMKQKREKQDITDKQVLKLLDAALARYSIKTLGFNQP